MTFTFYMLFKCRADCLISFFSQVDRKCSHDSKIIQASEGNCNALVKEVDLQRYSFEGSANTFVCKFVVEDSLQSFFYCSCSPKVQSVMQIFELTPNSHTTVCTPVPDNLQLLFRFDLVHLDCSKIIQASERNCKLFIIRVRRKSSLHFLISVQSI